MRILIVSPWLPYPNTHPGISIRNFHLMRALANQHEVVALCGGFGPWETSSHETKEEYCNTFSRLCPNVKVRWNDFQLDEVPINQYQGLLAKLGTQVAAVAKEEGVHLVHLESPLMFEFSDFAPVMAELHNANISVVLDEHNIEFIEAQRQGELLSKRSQEQGELPGKPSGVSMRHFGMYVQYRQQWWMQNEPQMWEQADLVLCCSNTDRDIIRIMVPESEAIVVPNGVDITYYQTERPCPAHYNTLFTGLMLHMPNIDAAAFFRRDVLPLIWKEFPDTTFTVAGRIADNGLLVNQEILRIEPDPRVVFTGYVPDTRPYFEECSVFVVPLRAGAGTRLKILEAMSMGRPVVSTTVGCEGIDVHPGHDILIADEPEDFASAVCALLRDPVLRERLAHNGRTLAQTQYSWQGIGEQLCNFYDWYFARSSRSARRATRHNGGGSKPSLEVSANRADNPFKVFEAMGLLGGTQGNGTPQS